MSIDTMPTKVWAEFWPDDAAAGVRATVEVTRDEYDPGKVAISTYVDGRGSVTSYYLDREAAISLARELLSAAALR